jgi:hypothetical protein
VGIDNEILETMDSEKELERMTDGAMEQMKISNLDFGGGGGGGHSTIGIC